MVRKIEISHKTVIFTAGFLLSLWFLYFIRDIVLELFVALLIMAILNPLVTRLSKLRIPRTVSVLVSYVLVIGIIALGVAGVIPPLIEQTAGFASSLPSYLVNLGIDKYISDQLITQFLSQIGNLPGQAVKFGVEVFSNVLAVVSVLIFAFYLLLARNKLNEHLSSWFGEEKGERIGTAIDLLEKRLGGWARGQLILMFLIGLASFIGLTLLGIPFALPLAILAGIFELVPYLGPIISSVPAVIIGLSISPLMGLATVVLAIFIHQTESYLFVPKVMEKSVGVSPMVTLLALAIGFRLAGVVGVILSVPVVIVLQNLTREYFSAK